MPNEFFTISIHVPANLARNLMAAAGRGARAGIAEGILLLQRTVVQNILAGRDVQNFGPAIFTGTLEEHIVSEMSKVGLSPEGLVGVASPADIYALTLEEGRTPGAKMPPPDALVPWVEEKFSDAVSSGVKVLTRTEKSFMTGSQQKHSSALQIAWLVARSIGRKGFPGVHMFRNAVASQEANVVALVDLRIQEAVAKEAAK